MEILKKGFIWFLVIVLFIFFAKIQGDDTLLTMVVFGIFGSVAAISTKYLWRWYDVKEQTS